MAKLLLAALLCLAAVAGAAREPSRPPMEGFGCAWKPFESKELGIRLLVQDCTDPRAHYEFSIKDGWLEEHRPSDPMTYGPAQIIRVLTKPADQKIEDAIAQQFIATLTDPAAKASCKVRPFKNAGVKGKDKLLFTIMPTGAYAKKIDKELQQEPRDFGCGDYGAGQSTMYFEYHPGETKTKFLWVDTGQDEPLFDQASIEFLAE
ncbi:MAG TPA: hypothetical protein VN808_14490 [Stellaceae bacterium]|nr:hypothetical protein [Stellaceae bacterium]